MDAPIAPIDVVDDKVEAWETASVSILGTFYGSGTESHNTRAHKIHRLRMQGEIVLPRETPKMMMVVDGDILLAAATCPPAAVVEHLFKTLLRVRQAEFEAQEGVNTLKFMIKKPPFFFLAQGFLSKLGRSWPSFLNFWADLDEDSGKI